MKLFASISCLSTSKYISDAGLLTSVVGLYFVFLMNIYAIWILVKARNRFKHRRIIDLSDLAAVLFGDGAKIYLQLLICLSNLQFLFCYELYFGKELDTLVCETLSIGVCGNQKLYVLMINIILLPAVFQKTFKNVAYFSFTAMIFTFIAYGIMFYVSYDIYNMPESKT